MSVTSCCLGVSYCANGACFCAGHFGMMPLNVTKSILFAKI